MIRGPRLAGSHTRLASVCRARPVSRLVVLAFGPGAVSSTGTKEKLEKEKGFINQMRIVAMKLHTREQAPKEGGVEAPKQPAFAPTREGYVRFLAESKAVYDAMEAAVKDTTHPEYAAFQNTGLERAQALAKDLEWFKATYGIDAPAVQEDGPGRSYAKKILELAKTDPQAFICHFYNFYFAHTAGGQMIGKKVASMVLDNHNLNFYQWEGDVQVHLDAVRKSINGLAESWTEEQKKHCLEETAESFKMSGVILRCITQ